MPVSLMFGEIVFQVALIACFSLDVNALGMFTRFRLLSSRGLLYMSVDGLCGSLSLPPIVHMSMQPFYATQSYPLSFQASGYQDKM